PCVSRTSASEIYTLSLHDALPMSLLSIFPAVMVVGNLLPMIGIDAKTILAYLSTAIPESVYDFIQPLIYDFLRRGSGGVLTTGALIALWSTSQGIAAFQRSVNHAYGIAANQNPVMNRIVSFVWMIVVLVIDRKTTRLNSS